MLPRMNGGKAPMAIYSGFTGNHAILSIGTARARQPRVLDLNGGFSLNRSLAIGLLYDRTWSAADHRCRRLRQLYGGSWVRNQIYSLAYLRLVAARIMPAQDKFPNDLSAHHYHVGCTINYMI